MQGLLCEKNLAHLVTQISISVPRANGFAFPCLKVRGVCSAMSFLLASPKCPRWRILSRASTRSRRSRSPWSVRSWRRTPQAGGLPGSASRTSGSRRPGEGCWAARPSLFEGAGFSGPLWWEAATLGGQQKATLLVPPPKKKNKETGPPPKKKKKGKKRSRGRR